MSPIVSEQLLSIVKASRPSGWCFGPILFAIGLIHSRPQPKTTSLLLTAAQIFSLSFPLATIVFGMNDVYDYDSDIHNPRKLESGLEGGVLDPIYHSSIRLAAYLSTVLILLIASLTLRSQNILATVLLLLLGWQYSALPLRLKNIPLLDSFSNGMIVFLSWFTGYSSGGGRIASAPKKGFILSLCTTGVHALGAVVDAESDLAAGQKTIATFLGQRPSALFGAVTYFSALLIEGDSTGIFGIYLWGGFTVMLAPGFYLPWAHHAFKAIVYWTVTMALVWFGAKAFSSNTGR